MKEFSCDLTLAGKVPAWRPATGYAFYGKEEKLYFAWLAVGPVRADCRHHGVRGSEARGPGLGVP